jgi:sporulation protein YlmC with PRC-barrel domain
MTVSLNDLIGRKVVAVDTADELGSIGHVRIDPGTGRITAMTVGKGRKAQVVPPDAVRGIAGDVVTVTSASALRAAADDDEQALAGGDRDLLRRRVLTTAGYEVGTVADCEFDDDGVLQLVRTTQGEHPAAAFRSVGSFAVVVAADT